MQTHSTFKRDRQCWLLTAFVVGALNCANVASAPIENNHVVRVTVTEDSTGKGQSATGFLWKKNNQVVTSLHAVLHKRLENRTIKVFCNGNSQSAQVKNVLQKADLVLLTTDEPVTGCKVFDDSFQGQTAAMLKPKHRTPLYTLGWKGASEVATYRDLKKGGVAGRETLQSLVSNTKSKEALRSLKLPAMNLEIYFVTGDGLGGGYSGGPVVDGSGKLLAIVDGGLDNGGTDYNWLIPATFLNDFKTPNDPTIPEVDLELLGSHFSAGLVEPPGTQTEVSFVPNPQATQDGSRYSFVKTKTRWLDSLINTSDKDIAYGIQQLVQTYAKATGSDVEHRIQFDIFEDADRGLIIAVPVGQRLVDGPLENHPDVHQLRSDSKEEGVGYMQFSELVPDANGYQDVAEAADGSNYFPRDEGYFDAYIEEELSDCRNIWQHDCSLDAPTKRVVKFDNGNKVLTFGIHVRPTQTNPTYYDFSSVTVRDNIVFIAETRIVIWKGDEGLFQCALSTTPCGDTSTALVQLSQLVGIQLTTFGSRRP
jgi:hypothetical protein